MGSNILKICDKYLADVQVQKRFMLKFLFVFDLLINKDEAAHSNTGSKNKFDPVRLDPKQTEDVIMQLVTTLTRFVTLEFLVQCS